MGTNHEVCGHLSRTNLALFSILGLDNWILPPADIVVWMLLQAAAVAADVVAVVAAALTASLLLLFDILLLHLVFYKNKIFHMII